MTRKIFQEILINAKIFTFKLDETVPIGFPAIRSDMSRQVVFFNS